MNIKNQKYLTIYRRYFLKNFNFPKVHGHLKYMFSFDPRKEEDYSQNPVVFVKLHLNSTRITRLVFNIVGYSPRHRFNPSSIVRNRHPNPRGSSRYLSARGERNLRKIHGTVLN